MRLFSITSLLFIILLSSASSQVTYQGPAQGSVVGGAVQTTNIFGSETPLIEPGNQQIRNKYDDPNKEPFYIDFPVPSPAEKELPYYTDGNADQERVDNLTVLLNDFQGNPMGGSIPPDPHMAAGPNHIVTTVNSTFRIYDKQGNLLKHINADTWNQVVHGSPSAFDPQIIYDHYEGRWVMLWDNQDGVSTGYFFVSVSDDDDPLGTWYVWSLPAHTNGNTNAGNWGDYPGMGFDQQAIYILSRQFPFSGNTRYDKIRIITKSELYSSQAGPLTWKDIWHISYPNGTGRPDGIRPVVTYGPTTDAYFLHTERNGGNAVNFYKITNPTTNPVLTGVSISVPYYYAPPNANQLGGGNPAISSNGAQLMMAPRLYNGHLYTVQAIRNPVHASYSVIKYLKIDPAGPSIVEEFAYGSIGYFYLFPALELDSEGNVAVNFSRSGDTEYAGAFYTSRLASDPPGFGPSAMLKEGADNYVLTYGGDRNRWGDYHGIYRDPADQNNIWMLTEYVHSKNKWGTWVGEIRMVPFPGTYVFTTTPEVDFGNVEMTNSSGVFNVVLKNYGENDLIISDIPQSVGPFERVNTISFPATISSYDSLVVELKYTPADTGVVEMLYPVTSNNAEFDGITVKGKGYVITTAAMNILYGSSGTFNNGSIVRVDPFTGSGTLVGPSLYADLEAISADPVSHVLYGINTTSTGTELVRVNSEKGDAYAVHTVMAGDTLALADMSALAFNVNGDLYGFMKTGQIYQIDKSTGTATLKSTAPIQIASAAFNPLTNQLWASIYVPVGSGKDKLYKIDVETGQEVLVGNTGLNIMTNALIFDGAGELYGATGNASQVSNFIKIDTSSAAGTVIGPMSYPHITGLAYYGDKFTGVEDKDPAVVVNYGLGQNYPNPFNPTTTISYSLPYVSDVKLVIYNILGESVKTLISTEMSAGSHTVTWNGEDNLGSKVSSGIYFYELKANSVNGEKYTEMKKMILMK